MNYVRSALTLRTNCTFGPREQVSRTTFSSAAFIGRSSFFTARIVSGQSGHSLFRRVDDLRYFVPGNEVPEEELGRSDADGFSVAQYHGAAGIQRSVAVPHLEQVLQVWRQQGEFASLSASPLHRVGERTQSDRQRAGRDQSALERRHVVPGNQKNNNSHDPAYNL